MPSLKEMTGSVLTKIKYYQKEKEIHFQNSSDRLNIWFSFT
jgi:hypothetical protein